MHPNIAKFYKVILIGAGSAGLATSYYLTQHGVDHVIFERGQIGNTWATERWDSFHLVNPNWAIKLPAFFYGGENHNGDDPDGFLARDEIVDHLQRYAEQIAAPVYTGVEVAALSRRGEGYLLELSDSQPVECKAVVVATGAFGPPKYPAFAEQIAPEIFQLHSAHYKNADQLPAGAVLVVGSGQSGAQIAEDLHEAGRQVYLSVSSAGRRPRRYRGRDSSWWMRELGYFEHTLDNVDAEARARVASGGISAGGSSYVSGGKGGHDIYLRALCREGMTLLGSVVDAGGQRLTLKQNLLDNMCRADAAAASFKREIDAHIERTGMDAPADDAPDPPGLEQWPKTESPPSLDLKAAGIVTIIWATGFGYNYDWIKLPVGDKNNYPVQQRGVTRWPGLYFMGLQWMYGSSSAIFYGVRKDAAYVAQHIAERYGGDLQERIKE